MKRLVSTVFFSALSIAVFAQNELSNESFSMNNRNINFQRNVNNQTNVNYQQSINFDNVRGNTLPEQMQARQPAPARNLNRGRVQNNPVAAPEQNKEAVERSGEMKQLSMPGLDLASASGTGGVDVNLKPAINIDTGEMDLFSGSSDKSGKLIHYRKGAIKRNVWNPVKRWFRHHFSRSIQFKSSVSCYF